jgi:hypothetical protein
MDDRHLSNIPKLKEKKTKKKKTLQGRQIKQNDKVNFVLSMHWTDEEKKVRKKKSGKEGKLERNEHVLVGFFLFVLFFLKACAA